MSFILDALKKSDHKRQRGSVPDLLTVHDPLPEGPKKRSLWFYLLVAVLLINAVALSVWLYPRQTETQNIVPQPSSGQPAGKPAQEASDIQLPDSSLSGPENSAGQQTAIVEEKPLSEPDSAAAVRDIIPVNVVPQNRPVQTEAVEQKTSPDRPSEVISHPSSESRSPADTGADQEQGVPDQGGLPLSVRQDLPDISITGHIYSNEPASRIVNINGQILREGETVAADLKLEEITSDGIVLSFRGYRFHMRTF